MEHEPYLNLILTRRQAQVLYSEVLTALMINEKECKASTDVVAIPILMDRLVTLNEIQEKMEPHISRLGIEEHAHARRE